MLGGGGFRPRADAELRFGLDARGQSGRTEARDLGGRDEGVYQRAAGHDGLGLPLCPRLRRRGFDGPHRRPRTLRGGSRAADLGGVRRAGGVDGRAGVGGLALEILQDDGRRRSRLHGGLVRSLHRRGLDGAVYALRGRGQGGHGSGLGRRRRGRVLALRYGVRHRRPRRGAEQRADDGLGARVARRARRDHRRRRGTRDHDRRGRNPAR